MKYKNTLKNGSIRYIVFKEGGKWYAVALEFNIIEEGDDPREVLMLLFEAIQGYVKSAIKIKARPQILNQKSDKEYEDLWGALQRKKTSVAAEKTIPSVYTFGERALAAA